MNNNDELIVNKSKSRGRHIGVKTRISFWITLIIIFTCLGLYSLLQIVSNVQISQLFYNETSNLDYKVCLKENDYFNEQCLDKDRQYVANIIDYLDVEFKYVFNASDLFNYKYNYQITAKIIATEKGDSTKILYSKEEILFNSTEYNMSDSNGFSIREKLNINYGKYNDIIKAFKRDYTLSLDSKLVITLHVDLLGKYDDIDKEIASSKDIAMTIPLSEQTINIALDYEDINDSEVVKSKITFEFSDILFYLLCAISLIVDIFAVIKLIQFINKITKNKSLYEKTVEKIMREYNQIIVETKKVPVLDNQRVIEVASFDELIDAREVIGKPILAVKINSQKMCFVISSGDELYRFVLKAIDLEK